jgi:hypothetical protein
MKLAVLQALCTAILVCAVGVGFADPGKGESGKGERGKGESGKGRESGKEWKDDGRGSYFREHGHTRLNIPPGHYPPPGECRIWYPDRPPGHQPPPGKCSPVPRGAWVIHHPRDLPGHVHVTVYDPHRPGTIVVVGEFEIASGVFVRVVLKK